MYQTKFPLVQGVSLKASAGAVIGYCVGTFAKQLSKILIWWTALVILLLKWLEWCNYVTINYLKIDADIFHLVAKAKEGGENSLENKVKKFVTHALPLVGSGISAFYYGFKNGA